MKKIATIGGITLFLIAWMTGANVLITQLGNQNADVIRAQTETTEQTPSQTFDPELVAIGREVFQVTAGGVGCASCHGNFALGDIGIGPDLRGSDEVRIRGGLEAVEVMEFLVNQLTDADIKALAEFLSYLGTLTPASFVRTGGVFEPTELRLPTATQAQLIIQNRDRTACTFELAESGLEAKEIARRSAADWIWTTPETPITYTGACAQNPENTITVIVETPQEGATEGGM